MRIQWVTHRILIENPWDFIEAHGFYFMGHVLHHGFHGYPMGPNCYLTGSHY